MENSLKPTDFSRQIACLANYDIYRDGESWAEAESVWKRPLRPQAFPYSNFDPLERETLLNYGSLTMNRTLTALNEQDFVYMPDSSDNVLKDLNLAYSRELRSHAAVLVPELETRVFDALQREIKVGGEWNAELFKKYLATKLEPSKNSEINSISLIHQSTDPVLMSRFLLMQHAVDFLPESSHMARLIKGDYGETQSAMFRVLLDEFGYGKHGTKHSTLFKNTLRSVGLLEHSHAYWNFYLTSTLLNNNYFHMLTQNPERFFEYVGAITYAENSFGPYCKKVGEILKAYMPGADIRYYSEHAHIDSYHGSMTLNEILLPLAERFGNIVYPEFVKGIEMSSILQHIMEDDLCAQIIWMENRTKYREVAMEIKPRVLADIANIPVAHLNEPKGELSVPHVHDGDEFCIVDEGLLRFCHGPDCFSDLGPGECVIIAKNRLHGALVLSDACRYRILSIGDYKKYATYSI